MTWSLSVADTIAMPIDSRAMLVLEDVKITGEWSHHNWFMTSVVNSGHHNDRAFVVAIAEAWQWLFARSLVAFNPAGGSSHAIVVTTLGDAVLSSGSLARIRAAERLASVFHAMA